jgi:hypothetical protein
MTVDSKYLVSVLTLACGAVISFLGWRLGWSFWPVPLVAAFVLGAVVWRARRGDASVRTGRGPAIDYGEGIYGNGYLSQQTGGLRENSISGVSLPTATSGYAFLLSATVHWRLLPSPAAVVGSSAVISSIANANPAALAIDAVILRARQVTALEDPADFSGAQVRLGSTLGLSVRDVSGQVEAWATNVLLTLAEEDLRRLRKISDLRKELEVWEHQRDYERNKRTYLGDDVLKSTGSAVVWLLSRQDDAIERTVDMIGPLAQLSAAANDSEVPELFRHLVSSRGVETGDFASDGDRADLHGGASVNGFRSDPRFAGGYVPPETPTDRVVRRVGALLDDFELASDDADRALFVHWIVKATEAINKPEMAGSISAAFNPPMAEPEDEEEPSSSGPSGDEDISQGEEQPPPAW